MIRADLVTAIVLLALGLGAVAESWRMPRFADVNAEPWSAPGVVPGMLGAALAVMALILLMRSLAARRAPAEGGPDEGGWGRVAAAVGICVVYAGGLVGRMPFWLATFVFVFGFVALFEMTEPGARWRRVGVGALAVAAATSVVVPFVFQTVFLVRLP